MNYDAVKLWLDLGQFVFTGAIGFYVYMSRRNRVTHARISKLEDDNDKRLDDHGSRIARMEEINRHLPSHADVFEVRNMVSRIGGEMLALTETVKGMKEQLSPMNKTLDRVQDYLLENKK